MKFLDEEGQKNIIYSSQNVHNELFDTILSKKLINISHEII